MGVRLTVLGDALLDTDLVGAVNRLCPDAPVPVVDDVIEVPRPGGAALAAWLAATGGAEVSLVTPMADDQAAAVLRDLLAGRVDLHPVTCQGSTPVKRRVRAGGQSVVRLDSGGLHAVGELTRPAVDALSTADAVLVADYGRGITAVPSVRWLLETLPRQRPVVWDPHPHGAPPIPGLQLVTPNLDEADGWARRVAPGLDTVAGPWTRTARWAAALVDAWAAGAVAVTMGERGALLAYGTGAPVVVPAPPVAAQDTCGAGDAFAAAAAMLLGAGRVTGEAVQGAVKAATAYVRAGGANAVSASPDETMTSSTASWAAGDGSTGPPARSAADVAAEVHAHHGTLVATGGCFDLLHAGHVACLEEARRLGDALVVCVNSDASVRRLKGAARPVMPAEDRARVLQALSCVDAVEIFDEDTPRRLLRRLRPEVWAKGGDYAGAELPESGVMDEWGGQVVTLPYVTGRSTTSLVAALARTGSEHRRL
ncbi:D-glycero-beta-D-manno-heptose 1-phosphate adenylyltransferase [Jiangella asiatica]|uniref:D-glycero-beta-D-manno-heptose 1-phosphate adenylyltransferase n=1 Tax=Jiangella asiatica TaxID=2530372 RepID=A0A4R5D840_9ACTN|nr:D-glycero-beta-D-manno-heptose 1-phosphate adenylyltransferase [Jiangella asiatica]TDE09712.1 D-glycero-beta-D-manno-heptose 1-phosphate adenylyltransferase [Jiangella asiatica]